jgi:hypothetical protein
MDEPLTQEWTPESVEQIVGTISIHMNFYDVWQRIADAHNAELVDQLDAEREKLKQIQELVNGYFNDTNNTRSGVSVLSDIESVLTLAKMKKGNEPVANADDPYPDDLS